VGVFPEGEIVKCMLRGDGVRVLSTFAIRATASTVATAATIHIFIALDLPVRAMSFGPVIPPMARRSDLLDQVIVLNERHLRRRMAEYCATTMRTARIWGSRRIRQRVGQLLSAHKARFYRLLDPVACTTDTQWLRRLAILRNRTSSVQTV